MDQSFLRGIHISTDRWLRTDGSSANNCRLQKNEPVPREVFMPPFCTYLVVVELAGDDETLSVAICPMSIMVFRLETGCFEDSSSGTGYDELGLLRTCLSSLNLPF